MTCRSGLLDTSYQSVIADLFVSSYLASMVIQAEAKLVAIVDDDELMRNALQALLKAAGLRGRAFASAEEFLSSGIQHHAACLIADVRMAGISGLELLAKLNDEQMSIPTIFITAHGNTKMRMEALRAGAVEFLTKPFDNAVLLQRVRAALGS
jgi:FixJ family two-component response regulator